MGGVIRSLRSSRRLLTLVTALAAVTVVAVVLVVSAVASGAGPSALPAAVHQPPATARGQAQAPLPGAADPAAATGGTSTDGTGADGTSTDGPIDGSDTGGSPDDALHASDDPEGEFDPGDSGGTVLAPDPGGSSDQSGLEDAP